MTTLARSRGDSHIKVMKMLVFSFWVVNCRFCSHFGCLGRKLRMSDLRLRPPSGFGFFGVVLMSCKVNFHVVRSALQDSVCLLGVYFCWSGLFPAGGGHSHTLPIRVCAAQRGRDFEPPELERGIHFRHIILQAEYCNADRTK